MFLTSFIIGALIGYAIGSIIGEAEIQERLQEDEAFYGEIVNLQPDTVTIQEIDEDGDEIQTCELDSEDGVSDDLYEGQIIYA